jgi:hypothetical protein
MTTPLPLRALPTRLTGRSGFHCGFFPMRRLAMSRITEMDEGKGYFQFPLSLLAFGEDYKDRLRHIVAFCLCEEAKRRNPKFLKFARNASLNTAASFLGVTIGSHARIISKNVGPA